jgi:hypothetical protein
MFQIDTRPDLLSSFFDLNHIYQARETLIGTMKEQVERRKADVAALEGLVQDVTRQIQDAHLALETDDPMAD